MVRCITCNVFRMRKFGRFLYCLVWSETVEFKCLPCPNNEMYGDAVFAIRFQYQLAIFWMRVLIWLPRLLHARIACEIDTDIIIAAFFRISYCLLDLIRLNSLVCHDQTTRYTIMQFSLIDSAIIWHIFGMCILIRLSRLLNTHISYEIAI